MTIPMNIVANSENYHSLTELRDQNANPILPANVLVKVSATDKNAAQVLAPTVMPAVATNPDGTSVWGYSSPAPTWAPGGGPWTIHIIVYDPTGATIYHDFACTGTQAD